MKKLLKKIRNKTIFMLIAILIVACGNDGGNDSFTPTIPETVSYVTSIDIVKVNDISTVDDKYYIGSFYSGGWVKNLNIDLDVVSDYEDTPVDTLDINTKYGILLSGHSDIKNIDHVCVVFNTYTDQEYQCVKYLDNFVDDNNEFEILVPVTFFIDNGFKFKSISFTAFVNSDEVEINDSIKSNTTTLTMMVNNG